ncbi:MAG: hypothetical protein IJ689_06590 [Alphaproteobacteria bacterium]|nr:hypothetical protein [Alphaproteobacteria bacterium]
MKNYILMLGVAGVALGSYCAYAGNSATMTVTATIAHDVSLNVDHDLNMGTITINPGADWSGGGSFGIRQDGTINFKSDNIISVTGFSFGTFTANVPDSCKVDGIALSGNHPCFRANFPTISSADFMEPTVIYDSGNKFMFMYYSMVWAESGVPQSGTFSDDITIEYIL